MHDLDLMVNLQLEGKHKEAREISEKLEALGPDRILDVSGNVSSDIWLRHSFNRGWFLLQKGDYQAGSKALENGRLISVYGSARLATKAPLYNPNEHDIKGKTIILSSEGGIGDEIIHARFVSSLKNLGAGKVYIACANDLVTVFKRIEGVEDAIPHNKINTIEHDYWLPAFSAGWVCGHTFEDLPNKKYLSSNPTYVDKFKNIINSDKINVGIRWAGNPKFEHQQYRKFPTEFMTNLAKYKELQIYSLQRDENLIQLPDNIIDLQHSLETWEDTLGAIENLDIVITSCTSIAHASAALGKETWILIPALPYHTWAYQSPDSNTTPYYQTATLFRQIKKNNWNYAFQNLYSALEEKFKLEHLDLPNEDKEYKKLNLGCGLSKLEGYINVDINPMTDADQIIDLNVFPWPFETSSMSHINAGNVLHLLGDNPSDIIKVINEMYRVSADGAVWEVTTPHPRQDAFLGDPERKRFITGSTFLLFDKQLSVNVLNSGLGDITPAITHDVDIEITSHKHSFNDDIGMQVTKNMIPTDVADDMMFRAFNVGSESHYDILVHKPSRVTVKELNDAISYRKSNSKVTKTPTLTPINQVNVSNQQSKTNMQWQPLYNAKANQTNKANDTLTRFVQAMDRS